MIPATAVPPHTLDRIAFCKSVREKRKQLQLNLHPNGKTIIFSRDKNKSMSVCLFSSPRV